MKIILLQDVPGIGRKYELKDVADGFARNFLLPCKKALVATEGVLKDIEKHRLAHEKEAEEKKTALKETLKALENSRISIDVKTNEKGILFAALDATDVAHALKKQKHVEVDPSLIHIDTHIKKVGEHMVSIGEGDMKNTITVAVIPQK